MKLTLKRIAKKPTYTIGKLYIDGKYFCDTCEDCDRGLVKNMPIETIKQKKVYGETAIPAGVYELNLNTVSPKFHTRSWAKQFNGVVPRLVNVPGFSGVLIHPGNTAKDSLGCILVGENKVVGQVINSQCTWHNLMMILKNQKNVTLEIG